MTNINQYALNQLPEQSSIIPGSIYYLKEGSQYVANTDQTLTKITDTIFVTALPQTGVSGKLYVNTTENTINFWNGTQYLNLGKSGTTIENYGLNIKDTFNSITELEESDTTELIENDLFLIDSGNYNDSDRGKIYKYKDGVFEYLGDIKGIKGNDGEKGDKGDDGATGATGAKGADGAPGLKGNTGEQGVQGEKGEKGDTGIEGIQGEKGIAGEKGERGEKGDKGDQGVQGVEGVQGEKGEMGDGFTITKSYSSISEMNDDFDNSQIPVGAFVIISSDNPDTDEDNSKVFVKTETEYKFQSVLRGLKGEDGQRGLQGVQGEQGVPGIQGIQGIQGPKGDKGDTGKGINVKGIVLDETVLPTTGIDGDAYWTEEGRLYVWSSDPSLIVSPGFVRGALLKGAKGDQGVQGVRGEKGEGIDELGVAELLTDSKTLKEAINEVFINGNNVKSDTVAALLPKAPNSGVTAQSSWSEIIYAITNIQSGEASVNGVKEDNFKIPYNNIQNGDFVTSVPQGVYNTIKFADTHQNHIAGETVNIGKTRMLVSYGTSTSSYASVRYIDVGVNAITTIDTATILNSGYGDYNTLCKLSDEFVIAGYSLANTNGISLRLIKLTDTTSPFVSAATTILSSTLSGRAFKLLKVADNKFLVSYVSGSNQFIRLYSVDTSTGLFTRIAELSTSTNVKYNTELLELKTQGGIVTFMVSFADNSGALNYHILKCNTVDNFIYADAEAKSFIKAGEALNNSGHHHKSYKRYDSNGNIVVIFIYNNSGNNNALLYGELTFDKNNVTEMDETRRVIQLLTDAGSGAYTAGTINYSSINHKLLAISPTKYVLVWKNNANLIQCGVFDYETKSISGIKTLRSGASYSYFFQAAINENGDMILGGATGGVTNEARVNSYAVFTPFSLVKKAKVTDVIYGVATSQKESELELEVTRPFTTL